MAPRTSDPPTSTPTRPANNNPVVAARDAASKSHSSSSPPHLALATKSVVATDKNTSNVVMLSEIVPAGPSAANSKLDRLPTNPASINDMSGPAT